MTNLAVDTILNGNADEVRQVINDILTGMYNNDDMATLLKASARRENDLDQLILGTAQAVRSHRVVSHDQDLFDRDNTLDICGTGGDKTNSFNISTSTALLLGCIGTSVVKNGNKAFSSLVGSSDVLSALGIEPAKSIDDVVKMKHDLGITFLNTPAFFNMPNIENIIAVRKALKIRTVFNLVGPLLNPLGSKYAMIGVSDTKLLETLAKCAQALGLDAALIVCSQVGDIIWDELTPIEGATNHCALMQRNKISYHSFKAEDVGCQPCQIEDISGKDTPEENAQIIREVVTNHKPDAKWETVVLNGATGQLLVELGATGELSVDSFNALLSGRVTAMRKHSEKSNAKLAEFIKC